MRPRGLSAIVLVVATSFLGAGALGPSPAEACVANETSTFGVLSGCFDVRLSDAPTSSNLAPDFTRAGGHPFALTLAMDLNAPAPEFSPAGSLKDLEIGLPAGFAADAAAVPACPLADLMTKSESFFLASGCPPATQVGVAGVSVNLFGEGLLPLDGFPVYSIEPSPGNPAQFALNVLGTPIFLEGQLGPNSAMELRMRNIMQALSIGNLKVTLWGSPADPRHTPERACPRETVPLEGGPTCAAGAPARALLRLPTSCGAPPVTTVKTASWEEPDQPIFASVVNHLSPGLLGDPGDPASYPIERPGLDTSEWGPPQAMTGCAELPFHPSLTVSGTSSEAGAPTGLDLALGFPQEGLLDPEGVTEADLDSATIDFPPGISINPSMANGLEACRPDQIDLETQTPARCPDASKLGTVSIQTPAMGRELSGSVYLASPQKGPVTDIPMYVAAEGDGVAVKLGIDVEVDEASGRMKAVLAEAPQVPFSSLRLSFFGGDRAAFLNPLRCGATRFAGRFVPVSGTSPVSVESSLRTDSGPQGGPCPNPGARPFAPSVKGGVEGTRAGRSSPFSLTIARRAGDQQLRSFDVTLPPGLSASLGDVPICRDGAIAAAQAAGRAGADELASPSCPPASQVGHFEVVVGAGQHPLSLDTGKLFLAGPYAGAPFSVVAIAPMLAGPLDLGVLALRMPLNFGARDGRVRIAAEMPGEMRGVRLEVRRMSLHLDRSGFILNPTRCTQTAIDASFEGDEGAHATAATPFHLRHCGDLGFEPSLAMRLTGGRGATGHGSHPGFVTTVKMRKRGAAIRRLSLVMPAAEQLDPTHLKEICTPAQFASEEGCPPATIYGRATLRTPILGRALRGPVYIRSSQHRFPDLVALLKGPVQLELVGRMTFPHGRVRVTFDEVPDVPLSRISLRMVGGARGAFVNDRNLCEAPPFARAFATAQNGASKTIGSRFALPCG